MAKEKRVSSIGGRAAPPPRHPHPPPQPHRTPHPPDNDDGVQRAGSELAVQFEDDEDDPESSLKLDPNPPTPNHTNRVQLPTQSRGAPPLGGPHLADLTSKQKQKGGNTAGDLEKGIAIPSPPRRYVIKFEKGLLEAAERKEVVACERIESLLEKQWDDRVVVRNEESVLGSGELESVVKEEEGEEDIMPSLEAGLALRSRRGRTPVVNGVGVVRKEGVKSGRVGRPRVLDVKPLVNREVVHKVNGNGIANGEHAINGDLSSNHKPKKMELELRLSPESHHSPNTKKDFEERNIDNVIFGDVTFTAWYPSWYPKEIIGEKALSLVETRAGSGSGSGSEKDRGVVVPELYVCKRCFGYGKVLQDWVRHCRSCRKGVPGRKVYVHGGWREDDAPRGRGGQWSIWEVDGGEETLFCQNLSLFAKLFLDNKSVFFDVSGFNYFLLLYTPPASPPPHTSPHPQIIGFFSKEKMSWDNNNLACILIFPPWQRKGLGALLMGVSYAIAKREGIMGGPEKPISELGRKGYMRYWSGEVARWLLSRGENRRGKGAKKEVVSIDLLSQETWIAPDDCLAVLREMGVVERVGAKGRPSANKDANADAVVEVVEGEVKEKAKGSGKVKIDREAVRAWCMRESVGLERIVCEDGFREGYAARSEDEALEGVEGGEVEMGD